MTSTTTTYTTTVTGMHTHRAVQYLDRTLCTVEISGDNAVITTTDATALLASLDAAKAAHVRAYLAGGGNPRNRRMIGSTWGAIRKAIFRAVPVA